MKRLFALIWHRFLRDGEDKVIKITGWRSAIIDRKGSGRAYVWFCFWVFN